MDRLNLSTLNSSGAAEGQYSLQTAAVLTALVSFLILFTISGNVLVIIAVLTSRALRAPQNLFLVSLATADILVVTLVVPFSLTNELMGFWPFGSGWCSVYLALDVLFCTSSISHLCAISLDRYWSVTQAVEYNLKRTPRRVKGIMMLIWLISAVVSSPPLLFKDPKADSALRPQCELNDETWYILSSSLASFFAPCLIMILVYVRIYQVAKSRARNMSEKKTSPDDSTQTENTQSKSTSLGTSEPCPGSPAGATGSLVSGVSVTGLPQSHRKPLKSSSPEAKGQITSRNPQSAAAKHLTDVRWTRELRKTGGRVRKRSAHVREKRFTFVLAVVIGVFVVCWFPFFFSYSLYGLCRQACRIPHTLFKFFFWIGYCNSSLNPVIYTIFNQDFRRAFHRILCGSSQKP